MQYLLLTPAVVGMMEFVKAINAKDWATAEIIIGAVIIGELCGIGHVEGLTWITGIAAGLSAAGMYKGLSLIGGN